MKRVNIAQPLYGRRTSNMTTLCATAPLYGRRTSNMTALCTTAPLYGRRTSNMTILCATALPLRSSEGLAPGDVDSRRKTRVNNQR